MTDSNEAPRVDHTWQVLEPRGDEDRVEHVAREMLRTAGEYLLVGASRRGRSHEHMGTYREDAFAVGAHPSGAWVIAVADGAGSCRLSRVGARIATQVARDRVLQALQCTGDEAALEPREAVIQAARHARSEIEIAAHQRGCSLADLSCTLLVLLYRPTERGGQVVAFQVGDGLVAAIEPDGTLIPLTAVDAATWAGETRFLTSDLGDTWRDRAQLVPFPEPPHGFLVASDGVADDLVPLDRNGPILWREVGKAIGQPEPDGELLKLLNYKKRGSFDDRTLVVARCQRSRT
jgi:serine/threonine protein phosphatase PrpC